MKRAALLGVGALLGCDPALFNDVSVETAGLIELTVEPSVRAGNIYTITWAVPRAEGTVELVTVPDVPWICSAGCRCSEGRASCEPSSGLLEATFDQRTEVILVATIDSAAVSARASGGEGPTIPTPLRVSGTVGEDGCFSWMVSDPAATVTVTCDDELQNLTSTREHCPREGFEKCNVSASKGGERDSVELCLAELVTFDVETSGTPQRPYESVTFSFTGTTSARPEVTFAALIREDCGPRLCPALVSTSTCSDEIVDTTTVSCFKRTLPSSLAFERNEVGDCVGRCGPLRIRLSAQNCAGASESTTTFR
jgi:hypothetical protein